MNTLNGKYLKKNAGYLNDTCYIYFAFNQNVKSVTTIGSMLKFKSIFRFLQYIQKSIKNKKYRIFSTFK